MRHINNPRLLLTNGTQEAKLHRKWLDDEKWNKLRQFMN